MTKHYKAYCKEVSDRDFIFEMFTNKGLGQNASTYLQYEQSHELNTNDIEEGEHKKTSEAD